MTDTNTTSQQEPPSNQLTAANANVTPSEDLALQDSWTVWFDAPSKTKPVVWGETLFQLYSFDTIGGFWSLFNNIVPPYNRITCNSCSISDVEVRSRLIQGSYYHVFRSGTKPEWEHARNEAGGKWVLSVQRQMVQKLNEIWLFTVMASTLVVNARFIADDAHQAMIGENFHEYNDQICGAVISVRPQKDRIALWTSTANDEAAVMSIGKQWKNLLNLGDGFRLAYQAHKESMKNNKNRGGSLYEC